MKEQIIDTSKIADPKITLTENARRELELFLVNDITLENKLFRIIITGKGCDGFKYECGFDTTLEDDVYIEVQLEHIKTSIIMSPFAAYYLQNIQIDFVFDLKENQEGFTITNLDESSFKGKFWKKNPDLTPPLKEKDN